MSWAGGHPSSDQPPPPPPFKIENIRQAWYSVRLPVCDTEHRLLLGLNYGVNFILLDSISTVLTNVLTVSVIMNQVQRILEYISV